MKILLIAGHGAKDPGATGNGYKEADLTREVVKLIKTPLKKYAEVVIFDTGKNAYKEVKNGTFKIPEGIDYALEIHFNAYANQKAHGTECFVTTREKAITVEKAIMKRLAMFFTLRDDEATKDGVKRSNFAVINTLKNRGISGALLEVCFITNKADMIVYQSNKERIAEAIVEGIVDGFKLKELEKEESIYYPAFDNKSIVNGLKEIGEDSSMKNRKKIATANDIVGYTGTAEQNIKMLELAKDGLLKKPLI